MQSEESNALVKLAKAVIEHAPEGADAFWDVKFSDIEAALSAAEPVAGADKVEYRWDGIAGKMRYYGSSAPNGWVGDEQPKSASTQIDVAKLQWVNHPNSYPAALWSANTPFGFYEIEEVSASDSAAYELRLHGKLVSVNDGLPEAKAAAQADYEARIRSALSAQVQDVAGWQPIETAPRDGTTVLLYAPGWDSPNTGWTYGQDDWQDCPYSRRGDENYQPTHWHLLPAAPAKQEGGTNE